MSTRIHYPRLISSLLWLMVRINLLTRRKERQHADLMLLEAQLQEQEETLHSLTNRLEHAVNIFAGLTER